MTSYSSLELVGLTFLSFGAFKVLSSISRGIWTSFLAHKLGFGIKWKTGDNVWAVITGATDGIGLEYAKQLAKIGYNLVIISRSEDKLKATQKSLKENYPNCKEVRIIAVDFKGTDIYDKITKELNNLDVIDVLVNNVGTLYKCPEYFTQIGSEFNESYYFNVNMNSYIKLIEIVLPKMVEQNRGVIINISSQTALVPMPLMTTYSATKAFIQFLSEGISVEYESKGVTIQTVLPSITKTKLIDGFDSSFFLVSAEDFVSAAIKTVGIESTTFGHWRHKLMAYFVNNLIHLFGRKRMMKMTFNLLKQNRDIYYKKLSLKTD